MMHELPWAVIETIYKLPKKEWAEDTIRSVRLRAVNGSTWIVTFDAGWGTATFYVNRNGRTWQAGMGEVA